MLHPVPPNPPQLLEPFRIGNPIPNPGDTKFHSVAEADLETQDNKENQARLAIQRTDSISQPEKLPPEFSPINAVQSAAAFGEEPKIGYPTQQTESFNLTDGTLLNASVAKSKNSPPPQQPSPAENLKLTQPEQPQNAVSSGAISNNIPANNTQNIQNNVIEFKAREQTAQSPVPSSIEFQSRPQENQPPVTTPRTNQPPSQASPNPAPTAPRVVEITSDKQEYDQQRRIVTAVGNVVVRFDGAVVDADRLQVSLDNLIAVGDGNVSLTRGDQVLRGQRFTYNFVQDNGELQNGRGEIYVPTAGSDLAFTGTDITAGAVNRRPPSDRITANQPLTGIASPGGIDLSVGGRADARNITQPKEGGEIKRLRFEANIIDFYPRGWQARNVRITNDPFSPPELELRADKVTVTRESPLVDRIKTERQRLVLDQRTTLPIPLDERTIDRRQQEVTPAIASIGFDGDKRGGVFIERSFQPINTEGVRFSLTPQFFVQKAIQGGSDNIAGLFGLRSRLNAVLSPTSTVEGAANFDSLDLSKIENNLRGSLRYRQILGSTNPHTLNLEYSYRDRLYNGTLGFQTVQSSLGGVITSPIIPLGKSGLNVRYQGGAQYINANSDRLDLLAVNRENNRISLGRAQGSATIDGSVLLWQGKPLALTPTEGLRYTANPVVPYVRAFGALTGTTSFYTSGDNQSTVIGTVGLIGQVGHFSRPFLDYTGFNVSYSQGFNSGLSPFLFDRAVDNKVLSAGITQQLYGPFRLGFQTSVNLDTGQRSSTDYFLEYSRRTYGITLRYNPVLELGGISFRISDFNWSGGTDPFADRNEIKPVRGGVLQDN